MELDAASAAILSALLAAPASGLSLPRLAKRLDASASVLLRQLALMGNAEIGGRPGPGWVSVERGERSVVRLTASGRGAALAAG